MKVWRAPAFCRSFPLTRSFNFFAQNYSGAGPQILNPPHGPLQRLVSTSRFAALLPQDGPRMSEIILRIIKLMLAALRALSITCLKELLERAAARPWLTIRRPIVRRRTFDNHPPSAWAAP